MLKNLVYLVIFTTFVVAVWIGLTIYHNFSTTTISEVAQIQIVPISNTFNPPVIQNLKQRKQVSANLAETIFVAEEESNEATNGATPVAQISQPPAAPVQPGTL